MLDLDDEKVEAPPLRPPLANTSSPSDKEPDDDLEKIRKWQEERIVRKLRGEYESSVMHLTELVRVFVPLGWSWSLNCSSCLQIQNNSSAPLRIASVRIEGANKTRESFLGSIVRHHLGDPYTHDEPTLQAVLLKARNIGHTLQETGLFHYVNAALTPTRDVTAPVHDVDLVFTTKERGRLQLKTATEFGNQEGSAVRRIL
jgi:outer membrane protein insertion porin family